MRITFAAALTVVGCAAVLAGCSSGSSTSTPSASMVGGMTECTKEAVGAAAQTAAEALGPDNVFQLESLECADGWAVAVGILGAKADMNNTTSPVGAPTTFIFEAEGQFWIPKEAAQVCGTPGADPNAVPADAQIPATLYPSGCLTL